MPVSDTGKQADESLTATLSELESLIPGQQPVATNIPVLNDTAGGDPKMQAGIPILDELVEAEDVNMNEWGQHLELPAGAADQMLHLIDRIEHRLTDELETLVQTLKSSMKESIIEELKTRLDTSANTATPTGRLPSKKPD